MAWKALRESELAVLFLTSLWLSVCLQYFVPFLLLLPLALIPGSGTSLYRRVIGVYDHFGRQATMAVPFSWCGMRVYMSEVDDFMVMKSKGSALVLANHGSRIDWVGAIFVGMCGSAPVRVGFVAEVTTGLMPIVGWSRVLFGDILLQRAFHKDGPRILKNIQSFAKDGIHRLIFLAPEGTIADPGVPTDEQYILDCRKFMESRGKPPLKFLLTPRYKGMSAFVTHAPKNVCSVTLSYVTEHSHIDPRTQRVVGGEIATRALDDPKRSIPDLHSIFKGGLAIYVSHSMLDLYCPPPGVDCDDEGAKKIRDQLIEDQERKDKDLKCFMEHRTYPSLLASEKLSPGAPGKHSWGRIGGGMEEVAMNGMLALHTALTCAGWSAMGGGTPYLTVLWKMTKVVLVIFAIHASSHLFGKWTTDGRSRESLVGETAIKAVLALVTGRDMNRGGQAPSSAGAETAEAKKTK